MVVAKFATTKDYGRRSGFTQTREIDYYNLEMITSIGYRVKSRQGILFRQSSLGFNKKIITMCRLFLKIGDTFLYYMYDKQ